MNDESTLLLRSIAAFVDKLGPADRAPVGAGLEFHVWRAHHPALGDVALRAPQHGFVSNDNDPSVDTSALLRREAELAHILPKPPTPNPAEKHWIGHSAEPEKNSLREVGLSRDRSPT